MHLLAGVIAIVLTGCATLQPVNTPDEFTPAPASSSLWDTLAQLRDDDWFYLLNNGVDAYDWRLRAIDSAVDSIDLQTFIWELDTVGHGIRDRLLAAAARGVKVRVLTDDSFILDADAQLLAIDNHDNIQLRVYNPYKRRSSSIALRSILNAGEFYRLDHRMHNKVMVIDGRVAVIGGRNLDEKYFGYDEQYNFRDMELVTGGSTVQRLANGFDDYWNERWTFPIADIAQQRGSYVQEPMLEGNLKALLPVEANESEMQRLQQWQSLVTAAHTGTAQMLIDNPPSDRPEADTDAPVQVAQALLQAIEAARKEIWLVSAYLIPTERFEQAIEHAIARGVRVRVLTNSIGSTNHITAHSAWRRHVHHLLQLGVEVHELREDAADRYLYIASPVSEKTLSLHAKLMLIDDDRVFIGSANFDPRSLRINTEVGLLVRSTGLNTAMRTALTPDFAPRNAWQLELDADHKVRWVAGREVRHHQPSVSHMRRIEDWFLSRLPLESEM